MLDLEHLDLGWLCRSPLDRAEQDICGAPEPAAASQPDENREKCIFISLVRKIHAVRTSNLQYKRVAALGLNKGFTDATLSKQKTEYFEVLCPEKSGQFLKNTTNLEEAQKLVKDAVNFVKECIKTAEEWLKTDDELDQKPLFVARFSWKGFEASSACHIRFKRHRFVCVSLHKDTCTSYILSQYTSLRALWFRCPKQYGWPESVHFHGKEDGPQPVRLKYVENGLCRLTLAVKELLKSKQKTKRRWSVLRREASMLFDASLGLTFACQFRF